MIFSVLLTLALTKLLAATVLAGERSAFTLELPPFRRPQLGRVIVRSVFDRTVFVLARAAAVAAPAGLVIYVLANVEVGGASLIESAAALLDPLGRLLGLDGVILTAFHPRSAGQRDRAAAGDDDLPEPRNAGRGDGPAGFP